MNQIELLTLIQCLLNLDKQNKDILRTANQILSEPKPDGTYDQGDCAVLQEKVKKLKTFYNSVVLPNLDIQETLEEERKKLVAQILQEYGVDEIEECSN